MKAAAASAVLMMFSDEFSAAGVAAPGQPRRIEARSGPARTQNDGALPAFLDRRHRPPAATQERHAGVSRAFGAGYERLDAIAAGAPRLDVRDVEATFESPELNATARQRRLLALPAFSLSPSFLLAPPPFRFLALPLPLPLGFLLLPLSFRQLPLPLLLSLLLPSLPFRLLALAVRRLPLALLLLLPLPPLSFVLPLLALPLPGVALLEVPQRLRQRFGRKQPGAASASTSEQPGPAAPPAVVFPLPPRVFGFLLAFPLSSQLGFAPRLPPLGFLPLPGQLGFLFYPTLLGFFPLPRQLGLTFRLPPRLFGAPFQGRQRVGVAAALRLVRRFASVPVHVGVGR